MNVKGIGLVVLGVASLIVFTSSDVFAQGRKGRGGGPGNYSVAAEITLKGTVDDVKPGPGQGTHVMLKTDDSAFELALGPSWSPNREEVRARKRRTRIDVTGAKSKVDGRDVLLVREIKKGSETMTFRDAKGFPLWAGRGRR